MSQEIIDEKVLELIDRSLLEHPDIGYVSLEGRIRLRRELFNAVRRMDVLSDLLEDDSITEIMINGYDQIFVEKDGRIQSFSQSFESEDRLASIIQQIVAGCNRLVNEAVPIVDARLPDGSRVNVVLPPVALDGPTMTIRKFPKEKMTMERLIELGALDEEAAGAGKGKIQHICIRRNGSRKDDILECAVGLYTKDRTDHHDRGFGRTAAA